MDGVRYSGFCGLSLSRAVRVADLARGLFEAGAAIDDFVGYSHFFFDGHLRSDSLLGLDFVQAALAQAGQLLAGSAAHVRSRQFSFGR